MESFSMQLHTDPPSVQLKWDCAFLSVFHSLLCLVILPALPWTTYFDKNLSQLHHGLKLVLGVKKPIHNMAVGHRFIAHLSPWCARWGVPFICFRELQVQVFLWPGAFPVSGCMHLGSQVASLVTPFCVSYSTSMGDLSLCFLIGSELLIFYYEIGSMWTYWK